MEEARSDYDGAWKEALEGYFADFIAFFFPQAHAEIDWSRGYDFLDKELQQVAPAAKLGPRRVDKLVQVWRPGGEEAWVLVHVEVQSQDEVGFAERMYSCPDKFFPTDDAKRPCFPGFSSHTKGKKFFWRTIYLSLPPV